MIDENVKNDGFEEDYEEKNQKLKTVKNWIKNVRKEANTLSDNEKFQFIANSIFSFQTVPDLTTLINSFANKRAMALNIQKLEDDEYTPIDMFDNLIEKDFEANHIINLMFEQAMYKLYKDEYNNFCMYRCLKDNAQYEQAHIFVMNVYNALKEIIGTKFLEYKKYFLTTIKKREFMQMPKVEKQAKEIKVKRKKQSAFSQAFLIFCEALKQDKIDDALLANLCSKKYTKENLKINYPLLKEFNESMDIMPQRMIKGHTRYAKTPVQIKNKQYLICNDIYSKHIEVFENMFK